jgi:hypothetical protein
MTGTPHYADVPLSRGRLHSIIYIKAGTLAAGPDLAAAMRSELAEKESRLNECTINEAAATEGSSCTARI